MVSTRGLRARLTQTSVDDLDATYALYLDIKSLLIDGRQVLTDDLDVVELVRRSERAMGAAVMVAQSNGTLLAEQQSKRHHPGAKTVHDYLSNGSQVALFKRLAAAPDEVFEEAIAKCRADGSMTRPKLVRLIADLSGVPIPKRPKPVEPVKRIRNRPVERVTGSARGRKTIEHMAISIDAIARGVEELDPGEVDREQVYRAIEQVYIDMGVIKSFLRKVPRNESR